MELEIGKVYTNGVTGEIVYAGRTRNGNHLFRYKRPDGARCVMNASLSYRWSSLHGCDIIMQVPCLIEAEN